MNRAHDIGGPAAEDVLGEAETNFWAMRTNTRRFKSKQKPGNLLCGMEELIETYTLII